MDKVASQFIGNAYLLINAQDDIYRADAWLIL
ncbi:hypothetical protein SAMD00079811_45190 [Scytonema sp. HK-05]|nr:hypothetical protein SAMD00079811_45190 [Scytonema sp. HK-05]